jgi:diaminohydroxyphosphoribosylaminopyrimidine deaminase/5-amino-6-(5-phosphoribosylamino)uracil reductase
VRVGLDNRLSHSPDSRLGRTAREVPVWLVHSAAASEGARAAWRAVGAELIEVDANVQGIDPTAAMQALVARGLTRILCEGGGQLAASLVGAGLVDDLATYSAGCLIGADGRAAFGALGLTALADAPRLALRETCVLGRDSFSLWSFPPI